MGAGNAGVGTVRVMLTRKQLYPAGAIRGVVEVETLNTLTSECLIYTFQSRESTYIPQSSSVFNPLTSKLDSVLINTGDTKITPITTSELPLKPPIYPGKHLFPLNLPLPPTLKPAFRMEIDDYQGNFGYELKVEMRNTGKEEVFSEIRLPGVEDSRLTSGSIDNYVMFSQGKREIITFYPIFREKGEVEVVSRVIKPVIVDNQSFDVVLDIDNTRNPHKIINAYVSFERNISISGIKSPFFHTEIVKITELDSLPIPSRGFISQYHCQIHLNDPVLPTFAGDLMKNEYVLKLFVEIEGGVGRKSMDLGEIVVISREIEKGNSEEIKPLMTKKEQKWWEKWIFRTNFSDFLQEKSLSVVINQLDKLIKGKRRK